jgi:DNA-binding response OmpR family regulator
MSTKKVLIADDISEIRDLLRVVLESAGYDVISARNGEEAWELFNAEKPDIVLTDVVMPRIDGLTLCKRIKLQSFAPDTPVVIITAATQDTQLADGFWNKAAGSDGFITKPFSMEQVLSKVSACLENQRAEQARANDNAHE